MANSNKSMANGNKRRTARRCRNGAAALPENKREAKCMRFGVCCSPEQAALVASEGYDYAELWLTSLAQMSEETFVSVQKTMAQSGIKAETFNGFFPGDMPLLGEKADRNAIEVYAETALRRASQLGGRVAVMGSGGARRVPEGMSPEEGWIQLREVLSLLGDVAQRYDMEIAIEPLNAAETNQVTTVAEGLRLCREVNHTAVGVLADYFHIYKSGETLDALREAGPLLKHVHFVRPAEDRGCPATGDEALCRPLIDTLNDIGYEGRVSLECIFKDFAHEIHGARPVLSLLHR